MSGNIGMAEVCCVDVVFGSQLRIVTNLKHFKKWVRIYRKHPVVRAFLMTFSSWCTEIVRQVLITVWFDEYIPKGCLGSLHKAVHENIPVIASGEVPSALLRGGNLNTPTRILNVLEAVYPRSMPWSVLRSHASTCVSRITWTSLLGSRPIFATDWEKLPSNAPHSPHGPIGQPLK